MAFSNTTVWEVQSAGSDTANGGGFDPANASMATDLAATSATGSSPVVTSASYNFTTRDNGARLFVKSGTNWVPGWYTIASTSGNAATLTASVGSVDLYQGQATQNATAGCASTASPTGGTWSIDYSQSAAAAVSFTDLAIDGTTNTKVTSAANPMGKNFVGNVMAVTSGTGFTVQRVQFSSVTGTAATVDQSLGTLSSTGGHAGLGGALASPGMACGLLVSGSSQKVAIRNSGAAGTPTAYTFSTSANVSGGKMAPPSGASAQYIEIFGYKAARNVASTDEPPTIQPASNSTVLVYTGSQNDVRNLAAINPGAKTSCTAFQQDNGVSSVERCSATSFANGFNNSFGINRLAYCVATGCTASFAIGQGKCLWCVSINATGTGSASNFLCSSSLICLENCMAIGGSGVGFTISSWGTLTNCVAYGLTGANGNGFDFASAIFAEATNCLAVGCSQKGYASGGQRDTQRLWNCAGYNNAGGSFDTSLFNAASVVGFVALSADPFTNAAGSDFTLNSTAGGGAALKGLGWPATLPGLTPTNYPSVGAYQPTTTASGGPVAGNMRGGFING